MKNLSALISRCLFMALILSMNTAYPALPLIMGIEDMDIEEDHDLSISYLEELAPEIFYKIVEHILDPLHFRAETQSEKHQQIDAIKNLMQTNRAMYVKVVDGKLIDILDHSAKILCYHFRRDDLLSASREERAQLFTKMFHIPTPEAWLKREAKAGLLSIHPTLNRLYQNNLCDRLKVAAICVGAPLGSGAVTGFLVYQSTRYLSSCTNEVECIIESLKPAVLSGFAVVIGVCLFFIFIEGFEELVKKW